MNPDIQFGLQISLIGLGITFTALGALVLFIRFLSWVFPVREPDKAPQKPALNEDVLAREMEAAAAAVAVALLEEEGEVDRDPSLGKLLEK